MFEMPEITATYMLMGLGFVVAALLALLFAPMLWKRAVRNTTERIQGKTHITLEELNVDKEKLRSELSVTARQLDIAVEEWQDQAARRLLDIARTNDACNAVLSSVDTREDSIAEIEGDLALLRREISDIRGQVNGHVSSLAKQTTGLSEQRAKYEEISRLLGDVSAIADERKIEIVAMRTQITNLNNRITELRKGQTGLENERNGLNDKLNNAQVELATASTQIQKLEFVLQQREGTIDKLKGQMEKRKSDQEQRSEDTAREIEALRAEKSEIKKQMGELLRGLETELAKERSASRQLREEMNNVAARVANLSPGSGEAKPNLFPWERDPAAIRAANGRAQGTARQRLKALSNTNRLSEVVKDEPATAS